MGRGYNPYPERLPLSRLGREGVQRRSALRPVREGAARGRSDGREAARADAARARLPRRRPVVLRQRIGRGHARRRAPRPRRRRVARVPRPDRRLRALPRSQVRPDPAARLLLAGRRVPQQPVPRVPAGAGVGGRRVQGAREEEEEQAGAARRISPSTESEQLAETLALQTSKYMQAAWKVTGEPKEDAAAVGDEGEARLRALPALAPLPREAAEVLSLPEEVAGR